MEPHVPLGFFMLADVVSGFRFRENQLVHWSTPFSDGGNRTSAKSYHKDHHSFSCLSSSALQLLRTYMTGSRASSVPRCVTIEIHLFYMIWVSTLRSSVSFVIFSASPDSLSLLCGFIHCHRPTLLSCDLIGLAGLSGLPIWFRCSLVGIIIPYPLGEYYSQNRRRYLTHLCTFAVSFMDY